MGVILCVLCSNVQLHRLYARSYPDLSGSRSVGEEIAEGSWSQLLLDQATECAIRIQKTTHSDHIDADADVFQENRIPNDSVEDVKRMETVYHFFFENKYQLAVTLWIKLCRGWGKSNITTSDVEVTGLDLSNCAIT